MGESTEALDGLVKSINDMKEEMKSMQKEVTFVKHELQKPLIVGRGTDAAVERSDGLGKSLDEFKEVVRSMQDDLHKVDTPDGLGKSIAEIKDEMSSIKTKITFVTDKLHEQGVVRKDTDAAAEATNDKAEEKKKKDEAPKVEPAKAEKKA